MDPLSRFALTNKVLFLADDNTSAWVNQGTATVEADGRGFVHLSAPAVAGDNLRIRKRVSPPVPYVVTMGFVPLLLQSTNAFGLLFRENSTGKMVTFNVYADTSTVANAASLLLAASKYNGDGSYNAAYTSILAAGLAMGARLWLRIIDDNESRICRVSLDGVNWLTVHSVSRTDFLTADEVGVFADSYNATYGAAGTVYHWEERAWTHADR